MRNDHSTNLKAFWKSSLRNIPAHLCLVQAAMSSWTVTILSIVDKEDSLGGINQLINDVLETVREYFGNDFVWGVWEANCSEVICFACAFFLGD